MNTRYLYISLVIIRIISVLYQTGYIHPDEFFQSVEVVAGDIFDLRVVKTWEFNSSYPLRSMASLQPFVGWPLLAYKQVLLLLNADLSTSLLLVIPRISTTMFSLLNDLFIYKASKYFNISALPALLFYASSQAALVFSTRTLSNTWETACLSLFGILAIRQITSNSLCSKVVLCLFQGCLLAFSFFCRPTALIFLLPVLFLYLFAQRSICWKLAAPLAMLLGFAVTSSVCIIYDTLYYTKTWPTHSHVKLMIAQLYQLLVGTRTSMGATRLVVTPINFILYNLDSSHLAQHGVHPWFTHLAVNLPQLLGPLYILGILTPILPAPPRQRSLAIALLVTLLLPVGVLSLFIHQEARFLLPLIPLWIVLCTIGFDLWMLQNRRFLNRLVAIWLAFNLAGVIFWGFFHQGGVTPLISQLGPQLQQTVYPGGSRACSALVFYRTYMPPQALLGRHNTLSPNGGGDLPTECGSVADLSGVKETDMRDFVARLRKRMLKWKLPGKVATRRIYLIFPASGQPQSVRVEMFGNSSLVAKVFGHVSGEYPPDLYPYAWPDYKAVLYYWSTQLSLLCYSITIT